MSQKVGDYSIERPGGLALRGAGFVGVMRYAAQGRNDVNITKAEADDLQAHGLHIGIVNEHTADYMMSYNGAQCAAQALTIARAAGLPGRPIFFAGDFDMTLGGYTYPGSPGDANIHKAAKFLSDAGNEIGTAHVGFYGSYFACYQLSLLLPWLSLFWQTQAWSQGLFYARAGLYQYAAPSGMPGVDLDAEASSFAGFQTASINPSEPLHRRILALPVLRLGNTGDNVKLLQTCLQVVMKNQTVAIDGVYGPITQTAIRQIQHFWHLVADGIAGPQTDKVIANLLLLSGH